MDIDVIKILLTYAEGMIALERWDDAVTHLNRVLELKPDCVEALCLLGVNDWNRGEETANFERVLTLDPDHPEANFFVGKQQQLLGNLEVARDYYAKGAARDPERVGLQYEALNRHLSTGDLCACREMHWLFVDRPFRRRIFTQPQWDGSPLGNKTLLIYTEGGFGDIFEISRYFPLLKELAQGRVILECPTPTESILRRCSGLDIVIAPEGKLSRTHGLPPDIPFDVQISSLDFPHVLALHGIPIPQTIPYLHADPARAEKWKCQMDEAAGGKLKVGLRWAGNPLYPDDARRSGHLSDFAPLANVEGVHFFAVQKGARQEEAKNPPPGMQLTDLVSGLTDFEETAAALVNLDLLISTDTAVPHLTSALGIPVWLAVDHFPNNRWRQQEGINYWYPTMRLWRQQKPDDWNTVFSRMAEELRGKSLSE